jgi:hypothetical protein
MRGVFNVLRGCVQSVGYQDWAIVGWGIIQDAWGRQDRCDLAGPIDVHRQQPGSVTIGLLQVEAWTEYIARHHDRGGVGATAVEISKSVDEVILYWLINGGGFQWKGDFRLRSVLRGIAMSPHGMLEIPHLTD